MPFKNKQDLYASQQRHRERNMSLLYEYLKEKVCRDCGHQDSRVFEFDHLPQFEKKFEIGKAVSGSTRSWKLILTEIEKCEVVCANCHRIRSMIRGNWHKQKLHKN